MSYTNETTYYGLPLPTGSDKSTFTDNNTAFQAVDAALHTAYEQSGAATEDIVAIKATVANLIQADVNFQNDLDTEKGKIVNLQDKEVLQDTAIAAVEADAFDMITAYNEPTATSTHAYSVGDYFIYNNVLYKATSAISVGDTIVPDTNCETTNVTSELLAIIGDVNDFNESEIIGYNVAGITPTAIPAKYRNSNYEIQIITSVVHNSFTFRQAKTMTGDNLNNTSANLILFRDGSYASVSTNSLCEWVLNTSNELYLNNYVIDGSSNLASDAHTFITAKRIKL